MFAKDVTAPAIELLPINNISKLFCQHSGYLNRVCEQIEFAKRQRLSDSTLRKRTLVLDVDNTLLCSKYFTDEIKVGDEISYHGRNGHITGLRFDIDIRPISNPTEVISVVQYCQDNKTIPRRDMESLFAISEEEEDDNNSESNVSDDASMKNSTDDTTNESPKKSGQPRTERCIVTQVCLSSADIVFHDRNTTETVELNTEDAEKEFLIPLHRADYRHVDFRYDGFLVRIRPGVAKFLAWCNQHFDVILFTAAERNLYTGLLEEFHQLLTLQLRNEYLTLVGNNGGVSAMDGSGFDQENYRLWSRVFYRDSCELAPFYPFSAQLYSDPTAHNNVSTNAGSPSMIIPIQRYYLKNLTMLSRNLSNLIIVDNNIHMFRSFEPNSLACKDYNGEITDSELNTNVKSILERVIDSPSNDVRYALCNIPFGENHGENSRMDNLDMFESEMEASKSFLLAWKRLVYAITDGTNSPSPIQHQSLPLSNPTVECTQTETESDEISPLNQNSTPTDNSLELINEDITQDSLVSDESCYADDTSTTQQSMTNSDRSASNIGDSSSSKTPNFEFEMPLRTIIDYTTADASFNPTLDTTAGTTCAIAGELSVNSSSSGGNYIHNRMDFENRSDAPPPPTPQKKTDTNNGCYNDNLALFDDSDLGGFAPMMHHSAAATDTSAMLSTVVDVDSENSSTTDTTECEDNNSLDDIETGDDGDTLMLYSSDMSDSESTPPRVDECKPDIILGLESSYADKSPLSRQKKQKNKPNFRKYRSMSKKRNLCPKPSFQPLKRSHSQHSASKSVNDSQPTLSSSVSSPVSSPHSQKNKFKCATANISGLLFKGLKLSNINCLNSQRRTNANTTPTATDKVMKTNSNDASASSSSSLPSSSPAVPSKSVKPQMCIVG